VPVVYGTARTVGNPDTKPIEVEDANGVMVTKVTRVVHVASAWVDAQATLGDDSIVTVAGVTRRVRRVVPLDDGALSEIQFVDGSA
jgi:hypothetical protein